MTTLLSYILLFAGLAALFVLVTLLVGKFVRPKRPNAEKQDIYECGEVTVGTSWIQFDLRFYVVALLYVIFEVEVALFFPWASVFGKATALADPGLNADRRAVLSQRLTRAVPTGTKAPETAPAAAIPPAVGHRMAGLAFVDLLIFFAVLLVGFAYVWRRGDLNWFRGAPADPRPR